MLLLIVLAWRSQIRPSPWLMLTLVLVEVIFLNGLIAFNGAASNPFNAVLLVPLVVGFMLLPIGYAGLALLVSVLTQVAQLYLLPEHGHHGNQMVEHFYAMVGSFVITAILMAAMVAYFRLLLAKREHAISQLREKQLRDEQLLAIGTAAAQLSHDVATPIQSIRLLLEEVLERQPKDSLILSLEGQFQRVEQHLKNWRKVADDVRENRSHAYQISELWLSLQHLITLARPESSIDWQSTGNTRAHILADRALLPALSNIIINACEAAALAEDKDVNISSSLEQNCWLLSIQNNSENSPQDGVQFLGSRLMASDKGQGIGAVLSNATIEKYAGEVSWQQREKHMITRVVLPLSEPSEQA